MLWSSTTRLCFSIEASIICHFGMPHRQFTPCDWCPSIYNLWARTSQRRALSKRINSPPPNRCIFNRDQSTQNKIQCQTHSPFTSPFWVWTKPEAPSTPHIHRSPSTSGRSPTVSIFLGVQPNQDHQLSPKRREDLRSSTIVFIFDLSSYQLFRMGWTRSFRITRVYFK